MMTTDPVRHVARVVLIDKAGNVLLVRYEESEATGLGGEGLRTYWVPPGGALNQDESHRSAAARELEEETGLKAEIGPLLWERKHTMRLQGELISQMERYYLARVEAVSPAVSNRSSEDIVEHRWWALRELQRSSGQFFPEGFVGLVAPVIEGQLPATPLRI
jgi:ADP-ribose pyrophosphatase YjhB (NUDIX family)